MNTRWLAALVAGVWAAPLCAATPAEVEYAVQGVLAREGARFVAYHVLDDGRVVILFGANEPAWRVAATRDALQSHPDIAGVVWTELDGELCPVR